jgi:glycerol kinase
MCSMPCDRTPAFASPPCEWTGAASVNNTLMQFQADILGVPVVRPQVSETTALGAAYLAGLGAGLWNSVEQLRRPVASGSAIRTRNAEISG